MSEAAGAASLGNRGLSIDVSHDASGSMPRPIERSRSEGLNAGQRFFRTRQP